MRSGVNVIKCSLSYLNKGVVKAMAVVMVDSASSSLFMMDEYNKTQQ